MHFHSRLSLFIISLLLSESMLSLAASVLAQDLPSAISFPSVPSGEIVGSDPTVSRASPPQERAQERAPEDRPSSSNIALPNTSDDEESTSSLPIIFDAQGALTRRADTSDDLPTPFDTSISNNFTSKSCPSFFKQFLADSAFTDCYALSCLLRDSNSFFYTLRSAPATSHLLDLACAADSDKCNKKMSELASSLIKDSNCGKDYRLGNPVVTDAYTDFITYMPVYRATCLTSPTTNDYCFVDAVTNTTNPADYNVYSVAFGSTLSSAPYPTCNACLQATMRVFATYAKVADQPLASSYLSSAQGINSKCGSGFVDANVTVAVEKAVSAGLRLTPSGSLFGSVLALFVVTLFGLF
ncbi:conserved hypothetical protein [Aspergillus terreus NIH2624]|uniref:DUF7729 domain-containing protein n=1 Tax=Aspergillus terreus (strain NIH 2624 / FGSC A1156) TaxID=341663 RepID=Q0CUW8_ASPTN|nr:uncharacterized protein ATEG_02516 [Aspergillus terreus NIH2624]EAU37478.1 conserved hypothetical protein [Aspergillus terreus NIH2624]